MEKTKPAGVNKKNTQTKVAVKVTKGAKKESSLPADGILNLVQDMEPATQGLLHRFSLRLTAKILSGAIPWLIGVIVILVLALTMVTILKAGRVEIIAIDERGRVMHVNPRDASEYTDGQVINWANDTLLQVFDFAFYNYKRRLEAVSNTRFTKWGKSQLQNSLSALIDTVSNTKANLYIESDDKSAMSITGKRKNGDGFIWTVKKQIRIVLAPTDGPQIVNTRNITMQIYQVDNWKSDKGLAVNQLVQSE